MIGRWLGISVLICFRTGMFSHFEQATPGWLVIPSRPASLYRVTQGLHVLSGLDSVPLLLAKLWTVYPKLFAKRPWPPSRKTPARNYLRDWLLLEATIVLAGAVVLVIQNRRKLSA